MWTRGFSASLYGGTYGVSDKWEGFSLLPSRASSDPRLIQLFTYPHKEKKLALETRALCSSRLPSASLRSFSLTNLLTRALSASGSSDKRKFHCWALSLGSQIGQPSKILVVSPPPLRWRWQIRLSHRRSTEIQAFS